MDETHLNLAQLVHLALDVERRGAAAAGATADVGEQEVRREAVEHRAVLVDRDEHKATLLERAADDACVARVPRREAALGARPRGRPHRLDRTPRELRSLTAAAASGTRRAFRPTSKKALRPQLTAASASAGASSAERRATSRSYCSLVGIAASFGLRVPSRTKKPSELPL